MRQYEKSNVVDDELHDLKLRFELLEGDRKAYYETSQWAIRQNKLEISQCRQKHKDISEQLAKYKKIENSSKGRVSLTELEKFDQKICEIHKKYDQLQAEAREKKKKIDQMQDSLADLNRESETVQTGSQDSPQTREIRVLENRLDKAMIKYNEAQSIRKTYDQIVKKLQDERLTFDNQLAHFERMLRDRKADASELEMMSKDANHAKEVAKAELSRFEQQINEERKQRDKDLLQRKELAKQKMDLSEGKIDKKVLQQEGAVADAGGLGESSKEKEFDEVKEKRLFEYEETMKLIKEATGVSDIQEVIAKFQSQGDTKAHLGHLQEQAEKRIEELKEKKKAILADLDELKFSSESKRSHSSRLTQEFKEHLAEVQTKTDEAKLKCDRYARLLENSKQGIKHLYSKLESVNLSEFQGTPTSLEADPSGLSLLEVCQEKLEIIVKNTHGKEVPESTTAGAIATLPGEQTSILQISQSLLPQHNTRVKLRPVEFEEDTLDDDDDVDDEYGDVPDRESMKRHTAQMLNSRLKTKQNKKVKKRKAGF